MTATFDRAKASSPEVQGSPVVTYYLLVAATSILVLLGLAVVLSSSSITSIQQTGGNPWRQFLIQVTALMIGLVALGVGSRMSVLAWKRLTPMVFYGALGLMVFVALFGTSVNGNRNWVRIAGFSLQPSEFAKLGLALFLGVVLSQMRKELVTLKGLLLPGGLAVAATVGLVLLGHDMGTAMVIVLVAAAAYWIAGAPARFFGLAALIVVPGTLLLLQVGESRGNRINQWLSGEQDLQDIGMQQLRATWALASGGLWGVGPGSSAERWTLPESDNDFIYSIIGEEWGLVGTLTVLIAFGLILIAVTRLVRRHRDPFVQIASGAIGAWIVGQAFLNIAVVLNLLPVFGIPLPLLSSGGSSMIASLTAIGVLMAFARREPGAHEAFSARTSVIKRSIAVVSRGRRG